MEFTLEMEDAEITKCNQAYQQIFYKKKYMIISKDTEYTHDKIQNHSQ